MIRIRDTEAITECYVGEISYIEGSISIRTLPFKSIRYPLKTEVVGRSMLVRNGLFSLPLSLVVDLFFSYLGESGDLEYVQPNEEEGYIFKKRRFTTEDEIEKVDLGRVGKYLEEDILIELKKYPEGIVLRELRRITQNREILEEFSKKIRMYQTHTPLL